MDCPQDLVTCCTENNATKIDGRRHDQHPGLISCSASARVSLDKFRTDYCTQNLYSSHCTRDRVVSFRFVCFSDDCAAGKAFWGGYTDTMALAALSSCFFAYESLL